MLRLMTVKSGTEQETCAKGMIIWGWASWCRPACKHTAHMHTLRFGSNAKVLAECMLKYYSIS